VRRHCLKLVNLDRMRVQLAAAPPCAAHAPSVDTSARRACAPHLALLMHAARRLRTPERNEAEDKVYRRLMAFSAADNAALKPVFF